MLVSNLCHLRGLRIISDYVRDVITLALVGPLGDTHRQIPRGQAGEDLRYTM